jgi:hypothetical protein
VYPANNPGNFKILLKDPIEFPPDETWEVGLVDVHYPFAFQNIGSAAQTKMIFIANTTVNEVEFPEWQCASLKEVVKYIRSEIEKATTLYKVSVDELGRFQMKSTARCCDVGFSDSLRRLLGVTDHDDTIKYETASRRATYWKLLSKFWKSRRNPLDTDEGLYLVKWEDLSAVDLAKKLMDYLDVDMFLEEADPEAPMMERGDLSWVPEVFGVYLTSDFDMNFRAFEYCFRQLYLVEDNPPKSIVSEKLPRLVPVQQMFIYTNIIQPIDVNDETENLLRIVDVKGERNGVTHEVFANPMYQSLERGRKITMIHVYIKDEFGDTVPFHNGTLFMTLQFRRQRHRQ